MADKVFRWMLGTLQTLRSAGKTRVTTRRVIELCRKRLGAYDRG